MYHIVGLFIVSFEYKNSIDIVFNFQFKFPIKCNKLVHIFQSIVIKVNTQTLQIGIENGN